MRKAIGPLDVRACGRRRSTTRGGRPGCRRRPARAARAGRVVERAGDDEGRAPRSREPVVERRHRALAGAAQAGGEAVGRLARRMRGPGARAGGQRGAGSRTAAAPPSRRRTPSMPSRSSARPAPRRRPRALGARAASAMPGRRALEHEPVDDVRVGDGEAQRDPGAERVAERRRPGAASSARRIAARSSALRSTRHRGRVGRRVGPAVARAGRRRSTGSAPRTRRRAPPQTCRGR